MQAEALGLALGLLYQYGQGLRRWRDVEAETCHPWPPATFWRNANALSARLHVDLTDKALQVNHQDHWQSRFQVITRHCSSILRTYRV